ncbi:putative ribonuclease H-like domain-containing protein [Tanacetum coccineum]
MIKVISGVINKIGRLSLGDCRKLVEFALWSLKMGLLFIRTYSEDYLKKDEVKMMVNIHVSGRIVGELCVSRSKSLSITRSANFNLLSDQEYSEEEEAKATAETMEQYMSKTRTDYGSGVARPKIDNIKDQFELKGQFRKGFKITRGVIPTKTAEDAKKAIQEMAEYSQKWHNGTSKGRSTETSDGLAAIQAQLNNLGREIKKVNEKVYAAQVGSTAPGYYQRNNANPSYQERRQSMEDTLSKFMSESAKRHEENSNLIKEIQAMTDAAIRNQGASIKTLEIQIGQMSKNNTLLYKSRQTTVPFPSRLDNHYCEEEEGNHGPKFMEAYGASHINNTIPRKEKDPGSFTLPCFINDVCFNNALVDLGASVSVMPLSTYLNLGLSELAHTRLTMELADRTVKYPKGIAENVLVGIDIIMSDSEHSTVTYTSVPFPVEDDSDIGSPGIDGPPIMPEDPYAYIMAAYKVPPSPDYIPGPEVPPSPDYIPGLKVPPSPDYIPGPEEPQLPPPLDFVLEPMYPEYMPQEDEILPAEEQPLPVAAASPTADSPGYVPESDLEEEPEEDDEDPEEDPADYPADGDDDDDEDEDEDEDEEEEHPAPADSVPPVHRMTARISIRDEPSISLPPREEVERLLALTTPPPSPLTPLSSPLPQIPSPPLPIPSPPPNSPTHIEIPESCLPLRKRVRFASPTPSHEVGESSAAGAARQDRPTIARDDPYSIAREDLYGFVDMVDVPPRCSTSRELDYDITDTWDDLVGAIDEIAPTTVEGVNQRVTDLATIVEEETTSMYGIMEDAQDDRSRCRQNDWMSSVPRNETSARQLDHDALVSREAWGRSIKLAFSSSDNTGSTNEVSSASGNFGVNTVGGSSSSNQVSSTPGADEAVCSFFTHQATSPPLDNEDLQQIDQDNLEELDIRQQVAMLIVRVQRFVKKTGRNLNFKGKQPVTFDKSKVKCYNCHRKGDFAKECKSGRNQGKRSNDDNGRRNATTNEPSSQALVAQDGLGGYDRRNDFDEPVNISFMGISLQALSSSVVMRYRNASKQCLESFKTLQKNYDSKREKHSRARLEIQGYELALESLESRILGHEKNELAWGEKYEFQNYELKCRELKIDNLKMELEKVVKERDELKVKIEKWEESSKGLNKLLNSQMSAKDKNGLGYGTQLDEISNKSETDSEISMSVFKVRSSDEETTPANDRFSKADGYHAVPPPITGNFLTPRADISFAGLDEYAIRKKIIESKTTELNTDTSKSKTSETVDVSEVNTVSPVKTNVIQTVKTEVDKIGQTSQKEGIGFKKIKACFVCKSTDHLIKDCDFYAKKSPEPKLKTIANTGQMVVKPVWDNAKRVNHQKNSNKYPQAKRTFVPSGVLTKTGLVNPVRPNGKRAVHIVSTARHISTARPFAPKIA